MIKVVLCDDDQNALDYYENLITKTAEKNKLEIKIITYKSGEELLFYLEDNPNGADIIYLDILMGSLNGIEAGRRLRETGSFSQIIFLTTSNEYVFKAFDIEPYYYIIKEEVADEKFSEIFLKAVEKVNEKAENYINITRGATTVKMQLDKIYYFEIRNRQVTVHSQEGNVEFYSTLEEIEQTLSNKGFVRIHRSYLINCHHIKRLTRTQLVLSDKTELPISTKYSQTVQSEFSKYILSI